MKINPNFYPLDYNLSRWWGYHALKSHRLNRHQRALASDDIGVLILLESKRKPYQNCWITCDCFFMGETWWLIISPSWECLGMLWGVWHNLVLTKIELQLLVTVSNEWPQRHSRSKQLVCQELSQHLSYKRDKLH